MPELKNNLLGQAKIIYLIMKIELDFRKQFQQVRNEFQNMVS